ncbi:phosphopantetheine-binding protein [Kistimonas scapharcae]
MKDIIVRKFDEALDQTSKTLLIPELKDNSVLLETGLDSLGFAVLVALLEEELGFDPFQMTDDPVYPKTFGEFVSFYEVMNEKRA